MTLTSFPAHSLAVAPQKTVMELAKPGIPTEGFRSDSSVGAQIQWKPRHPGFNPIQGLGGGARTGAAFTFPRMECAQMNMAGVPSEAVPSSRMPEGKARLVWPGRLRGLGAGRAGGVSDGGWWGCGCGGSRGEQRESGRVGGEAEEAQSIFHTRPRHPHPPIPPCPPPPSPRRRHRPISGLFRPGGAIRGPEMAPSDRPSPPHIFPASLPFLKRGGALWRPAGMDCWTGNRFRI